MIDTILFSLTNDSRWVFWLVFLVIFAGPIAYLVPEILLDNLKSKNIKPNTTITRWTGRIIVFTLPLTVFIFYIAGSYGKPQKLFYVVKTH